MYRTHRSIPNIRAAALLMFALVLGILAVNAEKRVEAQESDNTVVYPLPEAWNGSETIELSELSEALPPLETIASSGDFSISYLPGEESDTIRILPGGPEPGSELLLAWPIALENTVTPITPGSVIVLGASARSFSRPDGVMLTIREFDGETWSSSSVPMQDVAWTDYSVVRQVGEDTVEVQVGIQWNLSSDDAWVELRDMELAVLTAQDSAQISFSPTDTPTPMVTPTASTPPQEEPATDLAQGPEILVVVTSTPTPNSLFEAATQVAVATQNAVSTGTATPTPANMVTATPTPTALRVTNTPTPATFATATYQAAFATAMAATTGTPTAIPTDARIVVVLPTPTDTPKPPAPPRPPTPTSTPTSVYVPYEDVRILTPTPTPEFPPELVGKILFLSDHLATRRNPNAYMINPDGTGLAMLRSRTFYDRAKARDAYSADRRFYAYSLREPLGPNDARIQVYYDDAEYGSTQHQLTYFGAGTAWAPSWSPRQEAVALVSSDTKNDEIWLVRRNDWPPLQLTKNDWEWDRSPSFSPDGTQIVFESNRTTGTRQLWIMDASGQNQRQITNFDFETWDPVWVKYTDD